MARPRWSLLTDGVVVATSTLIAFALGLQPIKDNSAFTHLATGIHMVARGVIPAIPRVDLYSYSAAGHAWTVQSWMPAWVVGLLYKHVGAWSVLALAGVAYAALAALMGTAAKTGRPARTGIAVAIAFVVGAPFWSPRPLMAGLICLALVVLIVERRWPLGWLIPLGWVWVQSHGSFPLGLAFVAAVAAGAAVDGRSFRAARAELRAFAALALGVLVGGLNPLGPRLVVFPLTVLSKSEVFRHIVEWKPLSPSSREGAIALIGIALSVAVLVRTRARWRTVVPILAFVALGLSAQRNVPALAVVLAWALGAALRAGVEPADARAGRVDGPLAVAMTAIAAVFAVTALSGPALNFGPYPVASIKWAESHGRFDAPHRVLSRDFVGNFLELRHGPSADVFIDDRVDMFPVSVSHDYLDLLHNKTRSLAILDRWRVDTVIWPRDDALSQRLRRAGWTVGFTQELGDGWVVFLRSEA